LGGADYADQIEEGPENHVFRAFFVLIPR